MGRMGHMGRMGIRGAGLLALAACGLPEVELEGVHVRLAIDPGLTPCGDPTGHMDRFIELVAAELQITPPTGDDRFIYYWLRPDDFPVRGTCKDGAAGCSGAGGTVYASSFPIDHELVHSLATVNYGLLPSFFAEGLAVAYELPPPPGYEDYYPPSQMPLADAVEAHDDFHLPYETYGLAGAFVAFLIERNGVVALRRALLRLRYTDNSPRISKVLSEELGASLATLAEEFDATRRNCTPAGFRRKLFECAAPEIEWDGALWAEHRTLDCDQDDVVGPFHDATLAHYRTITVPADATYALSVIGDSIPAAGEAANSVLLLSCGGCDGYVHEYVGADAETVTRVLPAGRYSLAFTGPASSATGVGLRIERVETP